MAEIKKTIKAGKPGVGIDNLAKAREFRNQKDEEKAKEFARYAFEKKIKNKYFDDALKICDEFKLSKDKFNEACTVEFNERVKNDPFGDVTKRIANQWSENVGVDFIKQISDWSENFNGEFL